MTPSAGERGRDQVTPSAGEGRREPMTASGGEGLREPMTPSGGEGRREPMSEADDRPARVRVRVDVAARRRVRVDRTRREIEEQTAVGEVLVRALVRAQLSLALRLSAVVAVLLGGLPLLFALAPGLAAVEVAGFRLPWLLLGILAYPFLYAVAWVYVRQAERNEQDLADFVDST